VKAGGKPSNQLTGNFGLYRKQEGSGRVDLSFHWLAVGQNETTELSHNHRVNQQETRSGAFENLERNIFVGPGKRQGKVLGCVVQGTDV
jgi:hypothetical protein